MGIGGNQVGHPHPDHLKGGFLYLAPKVPGQAHSRDLDQGSGLDPFFKALLIPLNDGISFRMGNNGNKTGQ